MNPPAFKSWACNLPRIHLYKREWHNGVYRLSVVVNKDHPWYNKYYADIDTNGLLIQHSVFHDDNFHEVGFDFIGNEVEVLGKMVTLVIAAHTAPAI